MRLKSTLLALSRNAVRRWQLFAAKYMDLERLYYAEGGFLISIPKHTPMTDITSCTSGNRALPRDLR